MLAALERAEAAGLDMSEFVVGLDEPEEPESVAPTDQPVAFVEDFVGDTSPETIARIADNFVPALATMPAEPSSVDEAASSLRDFGEALEAAIDASVDPWAIMEAGGIALLEAAAADETFLTKVQGHDELLDGEVLGDESALARGRDLGGVAAPLASTGGSKKEPHVFFVNGIRNTSGHALTGGRALEALFNGRPGDRPSVRVVPIYNHSALEIAEEYQYEFCRRALERDPPAADETWAAWLKRGVEGLRGAGCSIVDAAGKRLAQPIVAAREALSYLRGGVELAMQRVLQIDIASSAVNTKLVKDVQDSLLKGHGVILVGHSQGTMFVENAIKQLDVWWTDRVLDDQACGPLPVGGLYIAPAIGVPFDDNERYVQLDGDFIEDIGWNESNVLPHELQEGKSLHSLDTYLVAGTDSRRRICWTSASLGRVG